MAAVPLMVVPYVMCAVVVTGLCVAICMQRRTVMPAPESMPVASETKADVIMFKESTITAQHLRVKVS